MKVVNLTAENFKILRAVEITPEGNMVTIGGNNGQGKSSVMDAIWVAVKGRSAAPPKPVREGEEKATIKLDLGELVVTRTFTEKEDGKYTDTVRVEDPEGRRYSKPQTVLDALLGEIGFDPFDFVQKKPEQQAEILMEMVPLTVDLDELAEADREDFDERRIINREIKALEGQVEGIPKQEIPEGVPDKSALMLKLTSAADTNSAIDREARRREDEDGELAETHDEIEALEADIRQLEAQLENCRKKLSGKRAAVENLTEMIEAREPLDERVDTAALREKIAEAERWEDVAQKQTLRAELVNQLQAKREKSDALTKAMADREAEREAALAAADMPIDGLGFSIVEGKPIVTYEGLPFTPDQISTAAALRVSTAIAMAANPQLRVLRIKDGSLLDDAAMKMLAEMVDAEDYQLWVERVGTGGVGIVMEAGQIQSQQTKSEN